jgi:tetratricopeptide (TPR) repeat protein
MNVNCPGCGKGEKMDGSFFGQKGSVAKCRGCGLLYKARDKDKSDALAKHEWIVRKAGGEVSKIDLVSDLHQRILNGDLTTDGELLRATKGWVKLGSIPELAGLFELAKLPENERLKKMWKLPGEGTARFVDETSGSDPEKIDSEITIQMSKSQLEASLHEVGDERVSIASLSSGDEEALSRPVSLVKKTGEARQGAADEKTPPAGASLGQTAKAQEAGSEGLKIEEISIEFPSEDMLVSERLSNRSMSFDKPILEMHKKSRWPTTVGVLVLLLVLAFAGYWYRDFLLEGFSTLTGGWSIPGLEGFGHAADAGTDTSGDAAAAEDPAAGQAAEAVEEETIEPDVSGDGTGGPPAEPELKTADDFYQRGLALQKAAKCNKAIEYFQKAVDRKGGHTEAWTGLGECHVRLGELISAASAFRNALSQNSKFEPALFGLAHVLMLQGKEDEAAAAFERYLSLHPNGSHADQARKYLDELEGNAPAGEDAASGQPPSP